MECQILFSRKNKTNISKCYLLKFLHSMQSVKVSQYNILKLTYGQIQQMTN